MDRYSHSELFQEVIQDLCIRFIVNCPEEEHETFNRLFFQIEEAHWFYVDFYREKYPHQLPSLNFKQFAETIFTNCPLLQPYKHMVHEYRSGWIQYKTSVPVCGAIVLNQSLESVLLVRGIASSSSWSFPRGKINKDEEATSCAIREVHEETGLDISALIRDTEFIEMTFSEQRVRLYLVVLDRHESELPTFAPHTRGEIGAIEWHHMERDILSQRSSPDGKKKKYWTVVPFVRQAKQWIAKQRAEQVAVTPNKQRPVSQRREKPNKRNGKNGVRRLANDEIENLQYQIPTPRPKGKRQQQQLPIAVLKRGDSLPRSSVDIATTDGSINSSYSPPSYSPERTEEPQFYSHWSTPQYSPTMAVLLGNHSSPPQQKQHPLPIRTSHAASNSFLNFSFSDDVVGELVI